MGSRASNDRSSDPRPAAGRADPDPGSPERDAGAHGLPERVTCPFCRAAETELHSPFGSALSVATYWCRRCRSPFEWFKWERRPAGNDE